MEEPKWILTTEVAVASGDVRLPVDMGFGSAGLRSGHAVLSPLFAGDFGMLAPWLRCAQLSPCTRFDEAASLVGAAQGGSTL
jgi:hypothetical protein